MAEPAEKIIVFDSYDNVIMANLVKTKLDAYGIPCFLTEENFTSLYPIRNEIFPGTRVHIFAKDLEQAREIMAEEKPAVPKEIIPCPRCRSNHVVFEEQQEGYLGRLFVSAFMFLLGMVPHPRKRVYHCQDCDTEF